MNDKEMKVLRHIVAELLNNVQYTAEEKVIVETKDGGYSICGTLRTVKSKINKSILLIKPHKISQQWLNLTTRKQTRL